MSERAVDGQLARCWYVMCAGANDRSHCVEEVTLSDPTVTKSQASDIIVNRYGWMKTKSRGLVCPKCAGTIRAQETRLENQARSVAGKRPKGKLGRAQVMVKVGTHPIALYDRCDSPPHNPIEVSDRIVVRDATKPGSSTFSVVVDAIKETGAGRVYFAEKV